MASTARKLIVEVAADISQLVKGLRAGEAATETFAKEVTVDSRAMAKAQVDAAIRTTEALHKEAAAYRAIANVAEKGSKEQITAARLATQAETKLAAAMGTTAREASSLHAKTRGLDRDLGHATRGALSGSGAFQGFGRSLAFASGGFLAFHGAADFIRESVDAAREAIVAQRSLAAQMKAAGESFRANRDEVERAALSYGKFGFQNDEVIASLTVLERGTGHINRAIQLQGLVADLARAKNLELAAAANTVAKVFGGQETALRRAVPGLQRNAHGMDLIRLAQAKLAGQAAANTTAAERFHAVLHDTQEIVGGALLPTLNRYLDSLSKWLERMNRSGRLQENVAKTTRFLADAVGAAKTVLEPFVVAFRALAEVLGGNKRALELLMGAYIAFKGLKIAASVLDTAASFGKAGAEAEGAAGKVALLNRRLLKLVANPYTVAIVVTFIGAEYIAKKVKDLQKSVLDAQQQTFKQGSGLETTLVPALAKQIDAMKKAGKSGAEIIAELRAKLGGSLKADDLIAEAFSFQSGSDPRLRSRIKKAIERTQKVVGDVVTEEAKKGPTVEQRRTWFDAFIGRQLDRLQDLPIRQQLDALKRVADLIQGRIEKTKDITRKLALEDRLLEVLRQQKAARAQIEQDAIDALQFNVEKAGATKALSDDLAALRRLEAYIERRIKVAGKTLDREKELFQVEQQITGVLEQQAANRREQAAKRRAQVAARQFRALGLGPTGNELTPGLKALRRQADTVRDAIAGTFLDTRKTRGLLAHIRQVLAGGLGKVGTDVRAKIKEILDGIQSDLKGQQGFATRYSPASPEGIMRALGFNLTRAQRQRMVAVLAQVSGGMVAPSRSQAFALAGAGGVTINGNVHVHGVTDVKGFETQLTKRHASRPHVRRGAR